VLREDLGVQGGVDETEVPERKMTDERQAKIREAEEKVIEAASNHACQVAPWFRLQRCGICKALDELEKAKSGQNCVDCGAFVPKIEKHDHICEHLKGKA
jgi:hypothetical protein